MIKRIELINFMSHNRTVIEPSAGLTVLVGPNNCGKSAIVTALQILCNNDNSTYVLRHGAKECRVIVETDDGHVIQWSRKKTGGARYVIDGQEFDRLRNDSGVWDELKKTLRLPRVECDKNQFDVHFGEQRNPVFLLNDKGKGAAQFFASNSDAIRLVEMQDVHKTKVRDSRREQTQLLAQQDMIESAMRAFQPVEDVSNELKACEKTYSSLKEEQVKCDRLEELLKSIEIERATLSKLSATETALSRLPENPALEDVLPLDRLIQKLEEQHYTIKKCSSTVNAMASLQAPPTLGPVDSLQRLCVSIAKQRETIDRCSAATQALETLAAPPNLGDPSALAKLLFNIERQSLVAEKLSRTAAAYRQLGQPPEDSDQKQIANLESLLVSMEDGIASCEQARQLMAKTEKGLAAIEAEIKEWVVDNPTCPTCGNDVDAEVILSGGGHAHG